MEKPQDRILLNRYAIMILACMAVLLFSRALIHPGWLTHSSGSFKNDLVLQYANLKYFEHQSFVQYGELPLWHPWVYGGMPYIGHPHNQLFYPLDIFFLLIKNTDMLFTYSYLLHVFLAGLFTYLFLLKRKLSPQAALLSGMTYMASGMLISNIENGTYNYVLVIALFPMVLYLLERYLQQQTITSAALFAAGLAVQFYAGHPQLFAYSAAGLAAYGIFRYTQLEKKVRVRTLMYLGIAAALFFLLIAAQLLPMLEYVTYSQKSKGVPYPYAASFALPVKHLITLFLPNLFGANWNNTYWDVPNYAVYFLYFSIPALLLAILAMLFARREPGVKFFGWTAFITLFFAVEHSPLYWLLYHLIPGFGFFRGASKALFLIGFSGAVLAGYGMEFFQKSWDDRQKLAVKRCMRWLIVVLVLAVLGIIGSLVLRQSIIGYGNSKMAVRYAQLASGLHSLEQFQQLVPVIHATIVLDLALFAALLGGSLWLLARKLRGGQAHWQGILALAVLNCLIISVPMISAKDPRDIWQVPDVVKIIQQDTSLFRVLDTTSILHQYISVRVGIQIVDGYQPLVLDHYNRFLSFITGYDPSVVNNRLLIHEADLSKIQDMNVLNLLNVKYVLSTKPLDYPNFMLKWSSAEHGIQHVWYTDADIPVYLYENTAALPRAFAVTNVRIVEDYEKTKEALASFDPKKEMLSIFNTEQPLDNEGNYSDDINILSYTPNRITLSTNFTFPKYVILSEVYDPGWKAHDNGNETLIYQADYALRAVYVNDGPHTIEFVYDPVQYRVGRWLTLVGLIMLVGVGMFSRKKKTSIH